MCTILSLKVDSCLTESQLFTCQLVYVPNYFDFHVSLFNLLSFTRKNEELVLSQPAKWEQMIILTCSLPICCLWFFNGVI